MKLKRTIALFTLLSTITLLTGCSTVNREENNDTDLSSISDSPYGEQAGFNPDNPYPVIKTINNSLMIEIDYYKYNGQIDHTTKYYGISRGFISDSKLSEGTFECLPIRIKKLSQDNCTGKYNYRKLMLSSKSSALEDEFDSEAYLLEKNFRFENLVTNTDNYDMLFLHNYTQSALHAQGGKIFDIFLSEEVLSDLDKENKKRGTVTGKNKDGGIATVGRTIREILEDCGQSDLSGVNPAMVGVVQQGPGVDDDEIIALNKKYSETVDVPTKTAIDSLLQKASAIKDLNKGRNKDGDIDKMLGDDILQRVWYLAGTSSFSALANHPPGSVFASGNEIQLGELISELRDKIDKEAKINLTINYNEGSTSFINMSVEYLGHITHYLYRPAAYASAEISVPQATDANGLAVGAVEIEQEEAGEISSDPWCGFTPECKPAIYLYPEKTTLLNVKIGPSVGQRTITIPPYDARTGWQVTATKSGKIYWGANSYTHLFYEALTPNPKVPQTGWIIDGNNIEKSLYDIGRRLGLNETESEELSDYWTKKLSGSPYYFVGLIDEDEIERLEPLKIEPQPKTTIRIRFYFKSLKEIIPVKSPDIKIKQRVGFTAVEWGGYVK
ncbi:MAG: hypothetical protein BWY43_00497 [candidate division WS2 bacterium ADurb.Bin280]|uniref:Uncharacterized protein n=1 Tax=candidate division WS2 bacterium ADurb.Bin280 TaxID=1852829 RepID=A0A1V5SD35_9BACT|nr:MAG: hypothetical protein BWY43_00497 [candidate division WS2 bacterium ADurb.Bin280]